MKLVLRTILLLLLLAPFALAALVWFALAAQPAVNTNVNLSYQDIEHAKAIIQRYDPRRFPPGSAQTIEISERDLNLAANYLLHKFVHGAVEIAAQNGKLRVSGTAKLPMVPGRPYLNILLLAEDTGATPRIEALRIGSVPVPGILARWMLEQLATRFYGTEEYALASAVIQRLELHGGMVKLSYGWQPDALRALGTRLAGSDADALAAYQEHLLTLQQQGIALHGSATGALQAMFRFAQARSAQGDPIAENRAALLVLGAWASERGTRTLVPQAKAEPRDFALSLQQRRDSAQHFLVSAGIAAGSDTKLSNAIGIFKEVSDSRGGSGFSFADIAADRAGTRFGELATASRKDALRVQRFVQNNFSEADIMPPLRDLPEGLSEAAFKRKYAAVDSAEYRKVMEEIERRVAACRLYRD